MKTIKAIIIGYGDRGSIYSSYSLFTPGEMKIVGIVDCNPYKLQQAKETFKLADNALFNSVEECLASDIDADLYINATMDQFHYDVLRKIIKTGKAVLTEKPIVNNK